MPDFRGTENYNIDDKARLLIPARFRKKLTDQKHGSVLILMKTPEGAIEVYEPDAWKSVQEKIDKLSEFNATEKRLKTYYNMNTDETELDKQGRITLPKRFLTECAIEKEVTLIGGGNKIEIWSPEKLKAILNMPATEIETLAERAMM
jgi:MraZ protein